MNNPLQVAARHRRGATLIEVMLASIILAILALAGSAFVYRSRADIALQKNRRVAVELANDRLEELMYDWTFAQVTAQAGNSLVEPNLVINGRTGYDRETTIAAADPTYDNCLKISVSMQYNRNKPSDVVLLETLRGR
ncbi:MAG: prepilin-type N-terminal cleavage/methylation domain-containing protein [Lentisphaerae bacterium]|nr:prepilin-type N-terminal cleavage/methylation domain-containing protein [Lentisphaerota bacterium]